jgi:hypothetical protein
MIHCACEVQVCVTHGAAAPPRIILLLAGDGGPAGYRLRGRLEVEGLDGQALDALDHALAVTLGGRATLMLGPADLDNLLDGQRVEATARRLCREYDWSPAELARKSALRLEIVRSLLTEERKRYGKVVKAVRDLAVRIADRPTFGELLRRQRTGLAGRQGVRWPARVAETVGVQEAVYASWEDDEALPPPDRVPGLLRALGLNGSDVARYYHAGRTVAAPTLRLRPAPPLPLEPPVLGHHPPPAAWQAAKDAGRMTNPPCAPLIRRTARPGASGGKST